MHVSKYPTVKSPKVTKAVGVGLVMAAALTAGGLASSGCQPGALPDCDGDEECREKYVRVSASGGSSGSGGSGGGSGSGGTGGGSGGGGGTGSVTVNAMTKVAGCDKFDTLGGADAFFKMRCGSGVGCHQKAYDMVWQDYETPEVWRRMVNRKAIASCAPDGKVIDGSDYAKSVLLIKTNDPMIKCPDGSKAGADPMPPPSMAAMYPALTDGEKTCIENFVKAAAGK
jgi:hypothetical protein